MIIFSPFDAAFQPKIIKCGVAPFSSDSAKCESLPHSLLQLQCAIEEENSRELRDGCKGDDVKACCLVVVMFR